MISAFFAVSVQSIKEWQRWTWQAAHRGAFRTAEAQKWRLCGLTFELRRHQRRAARARLAKMYRVPPTGPGGPPLVLGLNEGCAPSTGANLWGASPLWEYRLGLIESKDNHEPKARARPRGIVRRKPECKRCEARNTNRIEGRGMRGELAHDSKAHRYAAYGK